MRKTAFYANGSSKNHGCEAIWRSTFDILAVEPQDIYYLSSCPKDDIHYGMPVPLGCIFQTDNSRKSAFAVKAINKLARMSLGRSLIRERFDLSAYEEPFKNSGLAISLGGDNYCYSGPNWLYAANSVARRYGLKTALWGCSVEKSALKDPALVADLKGFDLITVRESITYNTLINAGIDKNTKIYPDPAFALKPATGTALPPGFLPGNTVGINVSPLVMRYEKKPGMTKRAFEKLISFVLSETDMNVTLIPHVIWDHDDDRVPLEALYASYADSGRVCMVEDANCMELKEIISKCRFFVGARTHATIAAYSSCVPTLVAGYSVKARGIAYDLFESYGGSSHHVVPVQNLNSENDLAIAFRQLFDEEEPMREHLHRIMPDYILRAYAAADEIKKLTEA